MLPGCLCGYLLSMSAHGGFEAFQTSQDLLLAWIDLQGTFQLPDRFIEPPGPLVSDPQITTCLPHRGIRYNSPSILADGHLDIPFLNVTVAPVEMGSRPGLLESGGLSELNQGYVISPLQKISVSQEDIDGRDIGR